MVAHFSFFTPVHKHDRQHPAKAVNQRAEADTTSALETRVARLEELLLAHQEQSMARLQALEEKSKTTQKALKKLGWMLAELMDRLPRSHDEVRFKMLSHYRDFLLRAASADDDGMVAQRLRGLHTTELDCDDNEDARSLEDYCSLSDGLPSIEAAREAVASARSANYDELFRRLYKQEPPKWQ